MMRVKAIVPFALCLAVAIVALPAIRAGRARGQAVTLAAVGDVLFARGVGGQIEKHGADWLFEDVKGIISGADIAFCNLECTLSKRGVPQRRRFLFRADPGLAGALHSAGFDVICLANNHTLDFGRDPLLDTVDAVRKHGMLPVGAGSDRADALRPQVITRNGLRIGFLAYTDLPSCGVVRLNDRPTVAGVNLDQLPHEIRNASSECDVLVVSFHWGVEYMKKPTERQSHIARLCIDNGADLILGHHPHVLQKVDTYKGKPIAYSLGGFVWDSKVFGADKSEICVFELNKDSARLVERIPVRIAGSRPTR